MTLNIEEFLKSETCPSTDIGPRALLGSEAHQNTRQKITQSMCRTVDLQGKVKSACVGCQSSCMDIDAEKSYWDSFNSMQTASLGTVSPLVSHLTQAWVPQ